MAIWKVSACSENGHLDDYFGEAVTGPEAIKKALAKAAEDFETEKEIYAGEVAFVSSKDF